MHFWFRSTQYGERFGRYTGFNLFNVLSIHYNSRGEIGFQIGKFVRFFEL